MRHRIPLIALIILFVTEASVWGAVKVSHSTFQAVDEQGRSTFINTGIQKVQLEGILLNSPENWVDPTPNVSARPLFMGGEWEIFVQGEGNDHAGTACWMGQNYGNLPWGDDSYTNEAWLAEIAWLNRDPNTGYIFRPGDRVRVTGRYLFYQGKLNINEQHSINPSNDFSVELVKPAVGLPQPEAVTLADLKDASDTPIFDAQRLTGPEYYQARLVRIEDVNIINPEAWGPNSDITVIDANGLTFPLHLCRGTGLSLFPCPEGQIDVIGIMDQKSLDGTQGYRLLVLDYDGNGLVLGSLNGRRGNLVGDLNRDFRVNEADQALLEENLGQSLAGLTE
ncbi:hypothetical protein ACFL6U_22415 [Planctomycetota bacterium]